MACPCLEHGKCPVERLETLEGLAALSTNIEHEHDECLAALEARVRALEALVCTPGAASNVELLSRIMELEAGGPAPAPASAQPRYCGNCRWKDAPCRYCDYHASEWQPREGGCQADYEAWLEREGGR